MMKLKEYLIPSESQAVKVWTYYPDKVGLHPVVIVCHGIPGGKPIPGDRGYIPFAEGLVSNGFAATIFNFRGCGESSGNIDLNGWIFDLRSVYDFVSDIPGIDNKDMHIVGFSAGGAVAVRFITSEKNLKLKSLMLMATPADLSEIIPSDAKLLVEHFKNIGLIREIDYPSDIDNWHRGFISLRPENLIRWLPGDLPVCIVHGDNDSVVPVDHARRLFEAAPIPKELVVLEGASHQLRNDQRTSGIIFEWLKRVSI
jgi:alpha-beta hydrolase superfamily lysophospholipase